MASGCAVAGPCARLVCAFAAGGRGWDAGVRTRAVWGLGRGRVALALASLPPWRGGLRMRRMTAIGASPCGGLGRRRLPVAPSLGHRRAVGARLDGPGGVLDLARLGVVSGPPMARAWLGRRLARRAGRARARAHVFRHGVRRRRRGRGKAVREGVAPGRRRAACSRSTVAGRLGRRRAGRQSWGGYGAAVAWRSRLARPSVGTPRLGVRVAPVGWDRRPCIGRRGADYGAAEGKARLLPLCAECAD